MKTSWLVGMVMLFVFCTIQSGISEETYFGGGAGTIWKAITSFQTIDIANPLSVTFGVGIAVYDFFKGLYQILTWDFSMFQGVWAIFRWVFMGISVGMIVSLLLALRGTTST